MAIYLDPATGKILTVDGKIAVSSDCCCEECCGGCSGDSGNIAALLLDVDASGATYNPANGESPNDACCQTLSGTYTLEPPVGPCGTPSSQSLTCETDTAFDVRACSWEFQFGNVCESRFFSRWRLLITQADSGDYIAELKLILYDIASVASFVEGIWVWQKNLGSTKPNCSTLWPIEFTDADYTCPEIGEFYFAPCFYHTGGIVLTVDLP